MKNNALLLLSLAVSTGAAAQQVEEIIVIGVVPAGSSIETNKLAYPVQTATCLLYTSPSPRDRTRSRMPSSA